MVDLLRRWQKIYLFYGAIFFLLGLFGCLASDESRLTAWSRQQFQKIKLVWSEFMFNNDESRAIPAFVSRSNVIELQVYRTKDTNPQFDRLLQSLQIKLQEYFQQVITRPVNNLDSLAINNQAIPLIMVGFNQTPIINEGKSFMQNNLYFSMPEQAVPLLTEKLTQKISTVLPTFTYSKQLVRQTILFKLNWDTVNDSEYLNEEVFKIFLNIVTQEILPMLVNKTLD